jgi:hypothetical protein
MLGVTEYWIIGSRSLLARVSARTNVADVNDDLNRPGFTGDLFV